MRCLVTGAAGFLGASVVKRLLASDIEVRAFDRSVQRPCAVEVLGPDVDKVEWVVGDIADATAVARAMEGCAAVAHIAGILTPVCRENPILGAHVNLLGTLNVFEAAKLHGVPRVVYMSSASVFGAEHARYPEPSTHYGAFKLACEGSARAYWADAGIASVGLRPLVAYGPGREVGPSAGVSLACKAAAAGQCYTIPFSGRSGFVYGDEVAQAVEEGLLTDLEGAHVFSMGGVVTDVAEVVYEINRLAGGDYVDFAGPPIWINCDFDSDAIINVLPGVERVSIADGLARTYEHYASLLCQAR
ncbi:NAD-dependent epimerase/dehydratase family protein [Burkholderia gladioli]|uniref:NAD-dependent epimerase/dehydratase family protein n=1 Tax=Burkholderia gladioli TaxID=28095 RepID=UPI0016403F7E|nr:NAD(P)-dependent oxidoreductase [Burkholderia gladioli]